MAEIQEEHEHHASGIAKAGLTTGIIGTSLGAINALSNGNGLLGLLGGGSASNAQADKINALRDENLLLKSAAHTNEAVAPVTVQLARYDEQLKALRTELSQAIGFEVSQRQTADATLRQWTDDNFVRAKKCVDAQSITPPVMVFPYGNSSAFPFTPWPAPFAPVPPFPPVPPASSGTTTSTTTNNG